MDELESTVKRQAHMLQHLQADVEEREQQAAASVAKVTEHLSAAKQCVFAGAALFWGVGWV